MAIRNDEKKPLAADTDILLCEENAAFKVCLRLQQDGMECVADFSFKEPEAKAEPADPVAGDSGAGEADCHWGLCPVELIRLLNQVGIVQTIDYEAVYELCAAIELGQKIEPVVIARGIPAYKGTDGWFELQVKTGKEGASFVEDEKGSVDFKQLNTFSEIEPGQKLGIVHPPTAGIPGMTAHGLPIPGESGQPFELQAGEGVILKYNGRVAFADKSGRALLEKKTLAVVDQWVITGDVDLSVGNIDFHGYVEVKGDVLDDFNIVAKKGIKVHGHVGASLLESDSSIELVSMAGKGSGKIICRGDLKAKFLNHVEVVSFGHIQIANEIRNCLVKSTGRIMVEKGAIIGGRCIALEGIQAKTLGSNSALRTDLTAGVYFPDADRFEYLRERQMNINQQLRKLTEGISQLQATLAKKTSYAETARKRLHILNEHLAKLEEEKARLSSEIAASRPQEFNSRNPKINVQGQLLEGVLLTLGNSCEEIKIARSGPISIIENTRDGGLRFLSMTPMTLLADEIEQSLWEEEETGEE